MPVTTAGREMRLLCGDIGGTKTELAVFSGAPGRWSCEARRLYPSADFASFEALLSDFACGSIDAAGLGAAGPVTDGRCHTTNLPWVLDAAELGAQLGAPVAVINDFHAMALGIRELGPDDLLVLQRGRPVDGGPVTVLGAGTGFGCAHLPHRTATSVMATEAGHADFATGGPAGEALARYARGRYPRLTVEHVLSGAGLALVFDQLVDAGTARPSEPTLRAMAGSTDRGRLVGELSATDPACGLAVERFIEFYGSETANVALRMLPTGGLFIAGGIAAKLRAPFEAGTFARAFCDKPPMSQLLAQIPLAVVLHPSTGLLGARVQACMVHFDTDTPRPD